MSSWEVYYKMLACTKCLNGKSHIAVQLFNNTQACPSWASVLAMVGGEREEKEGDRNLPHADV